jgi:hypothetical protein
MTIVQMLSSMPRFLTSRYSGSSAATAGIILVLMKKNSASVHFATGLSESAYAAGVASATTIRVEKTLAISELSRNGVMLRSKTWAYWSKVGAKVQLGGLLAASCSCLKLVSTIQITGKTKAIPAIHATVPQIVFCSRVDFTGSPPSGRGWR